ncbi:S-layer homology domain-containing protein [Brooklawnia sp.]|uniref:S-layer homology domain-containing protein n=1 Tax=Brooklawnia sp. TaxID=2699740 RepID=UPI00311E5621
MSPFTDITPSDQFFAQVMWLHSTGISTGWSDGSYRPVTPVMRDAMAAFLYRLSEI